ncbi:MAG: helix-turn-helix domain-containing protein [archaeon]
MAMNNLKNIRQKRKKKQEEVAKYLNVSKTTYSRYESGKRRLGDDTLIKLVHFFNVSADYLLGIVDEPISPEDCIRARNQLRKEKSQPKFAKDLTDREAQEKVRDIIRVLSDE